MRKPSGSRTPKPIGAAIAGVLERLGLGAKMKQYEVLEAWANIVGEQIAKVTSADQIRDGKLIVRVAHSTWRNELVFLKKELIDKINRAMHRDVVKDIIFR